MKRCITLFLFCFLLSAFWLPASVNASCFNPAGNAGDIVYSGGVQSVIYCNGGAWIAMGPVGDTRTGLVAWWKLDDGSGTSASDSSGNGNTGTLQNSPTWTTGMNNGALTLNGTSQYVDVPDATALDISGSWTESAWVKLNAVPASVTTMFLLSKQAGGGQANYFLAADNTNYTSGLSWVLGFQDSGYASHIDPYYTSISTGTWYHIAGVYDSAAQTLTLYLNGASVATSSVAGAVPVSGSGHDLSIGVNSPFSGGYTNGTIDDTRVYNRALTAQDVHTLYTSTGPLSGDIQSNLVGWWKFDEGSGTTAVDSSPTGVNGTLGGTPAWTTGKINGALTFNAANPDYVNNVTTSYYFGTNSFSYVAWVNTTQVVSQARIMGSDHFGTFPYVWLDESMGASTGFSAEIRDDAGGSVPFQSGVSISDGVWHQVVAVIDRTANKVYLYKDGVQIYSSSHTFTGNVGTSGYPLSNTWVADQSGNPSFGFTGTVDDVRIYSRALSQSDVLTLYNTYATACAGPVGYAGGLMYNGGTYHAMQFCNGSNWIPAGNVPGSGGSGCASPSRNEGDIIYSSANHVMQYCDGANWQAMGGIVPVGNGLVGWWNFDEGSGTTAADSSGNGLTGTLSGAPAWTAAGKVNGALTFNAANPDAVANVTGLYFGANSFTYTAWVKSTQNNGTTERIMGGASASDGYAWLNLSSSGSNFVSAELNDGSGYTGYNSGVSANDGSWHHVALVVDRTANEVYLYVDGVAKLNTAHTYASNFGISSDHMPVEIGYQIPANAFSGTIDDVRIYNRALSAAEIWQLYLVTGGQ